MAAHITPLDVLALLNNNQITPNNLKQTFTRRDTPYSHPCRNLAIDSSPEVSDTEMDNSLDMDYEMDTPSPISPTSSTHYGNSSPEHSTATFTTHTTVEDAEEEPSRWKHMPVDPLSNQAHAIIPQLKRSTGIKMRKFETRRVQAFDWPVVRWFFILYFNGEEQRYSMTDDQLCDNAELDPLLRAIWNHHSHGTHRWMPNNSAIMQGKPLWTSDPFFKNLYPFVQCLHL